MTLYYHAFFGPNTPGLAGQQNLAREVRKLLSETFELEDLAPADAAAVAVPKLTTVLAAIVRLALARGLNPKRSCDVTVIDMVHSLATLDSSRARDRLIVIGHDSYALRARRDLGAARGWPRKMRLVVSWAGWRLVEFFLRRLVWRALFVSPLDSDQAVKGDQADVLAIPVSAGLRDAGARRRAKGTPHSDRPHILVSLPVTNASQLDIDLALVACLMHVAESRAEITLWGKGTASLRARLKLPATVRTVDWVDDYVGFVAGFDLLVYPRMVGSGFHTKLAEALTLGVPCLCVDWIATPLWHAGYNGIITFTKQATFSSALAGWLDAFYDGLASPVPTIPAKAAPKAALAPLLKAISQALTEKRGHDDF